MYLSLASNSIYSQGEPRNLDPSVSSSFVLGLHSGVYHYALLVCAVLSIETRASGMLIRHGYSYTPNPSITPSEHILPCLRTTLSTNPYPGDGAFSPRPSPETSGVGPLTAALLIRAIFAVRVTITVPMLSNAAPVTAAEFLV